MNKYASEIGLFLSLSVWMFARIRTSGPSNFTKLNKYRDIVLVFAEGTVPSISH